MLRAPGEVWSTVVCLAPSHCGSGHDGDEAWRRRASASAQLRPRGGGEQRGSGEEEDKLTAGSTVVLESPGRG